MRNLPWILAHVLMKTSKPHLLLQAGEPGSLLYSSSPNAWLAGKSVVSQAGSEEEEVRSGSVDDGWPSSEREIRFPFLCLWLSSDPKWNGCGPSTVEEGRSSFFKLLPQTLIPSTILSQTQPEKNVLPALCTSLSPVMLGHVSHHSD